MDQNFVTSDEKEAVVITRISGIINEVIESTSETAIIVSMVILIVMFLLAIVYAAYFFFKRKRQMVLPSSSREIATDYFTRPRPPVLFLHEDGNQLNNNSNYWQRPLEPAATNKDLYSVVIERY